MSDIFTAPWYPWYVTDVLISERVELMSLAEEGAYRRALDRAWKKGSIPADPKRCARAIGKGCSVKIAQVVLAMFRPMPGDPTRMINDKMERVRAEQKAKYLRQSSKGKAGAEKRWQEHSTGNSTGNAQVMPGDSHSDSDTELDKKEKKEEGEEPVVQPDLKRSDFGTPQHQDARLHNHPVIEALRNVTKRNPKPEARQHLIHKVNGVIDLPKLQIAFGEWSARGYKDTNFDGILDWYLGNKNGRAAKSDPGKSTEPETKIHCKKCLDTGEITQKPRNAKYEWELESVPCPNCKPMEKAA